jgi:chorismate synthase
MMSGNQLGVLFSLTTFGEAHGNAVGGVIDGCPANLNVDYELIEKKIKARQTANFTFNSQRKEPDKVEFLSGINKDKTNGFPIAFIIKNKDVNLSHYIENQDVLKPSHAHYTYWKKYGTDNALGSGRASARETIARVVGGCFAMMLLRQLGIEIYCFTSQIGNIKTRKIKKPNRNIIQSNPLYCPCTTTYEKMMDYLQQIQSEKDTIGAKVSCIVENVPIGMGEPVFDKLNADLAKAMLSIPAAKGIEFGSGFTAVSMKGTKHNDIYNTNFQTKNNYSGGIQGGISNGEDICFSIAFKPIPSIMQDQQSIDTKGNNKIYKAGGRHDVCVVPRVIPIVEAMTALVLADHLLRFNAYKNTIV